MGSALIQARSETALPSGPADTLPKLLLQRLARQSDMALRHKALGIWRPWTWGQVVEEVELFARALAAAGFAHGDRLGLLGDNRPRLLWAALAAQSLGGVAVVIDRTASASAVAGILAHGQLRFAVGQGRRDVDVLLEAREERHKPGWIAYDDQLGLSGYREPGLVDYDSARSEALEHRRAFPYLFVTAINEGKPADVALTYYTREADGSVLGLSLRHEELIVPATQLIGNLDLHSTDEVIAAAPFSWAPGAVFGLATWLTSGFRLSVSECAETLSADRRELGPTYYYDEARGYESLRNEIASRLPRPGSLRRLLLDGALVRAARVARQDEGSAAAGAAFGTRLALWPARWLFLNPLRDVLGLSRARVVLNVGRPLSDDVVDFYRALRVPLRNIESPGSELSVHRDPAASPVVAASLVGAAPSAKADAAAESLPDYGTQPQAA